MLLLDINTVSTKYPTQNAAKYVVQDKTAN